MRQGNRLVATDYAASLQEPLRQELDRIAAILSPPAQFDPRMAKGTFRVAARDFFAEMLMPVLGDLLHREAPGIRAQLIDLVPQDHVASLELRNADIALIPDMPLPEWVCREELFRSPFHVIARRGNPVLCGLAPGEVMPYEVFCTLHHVVFSPEEKIATMGDAALARVGRQRQVATTVPVFSSVCRAVRESDLIALVPAQLAADVAETFNLMVFERPMPIDPPLIVGIWHKRSDGTPLSRWIREQVFDLMRRLDR